MDTKFQTSFIPKKAVMDTGRPRAASVSVFLIIAIILFIVSFAAAGGVFIYKKILIGQINDMNARLVEAKNSFEPTLIDTANALNSRIEGAKKLLAVHSAVSPVFDFLENDALSTVKFDSFSYQSKDGMAPILSLSGQAKDFTSVALQSDIFGQEKFIKNPVFSDLNPDTSGNVVFKFNASLDPSLVSYQSLVGSGGGVSSGANQ